MITRPNLSVPPWADTGDRIQPDPASIASGFPRTNDKPTRQTMNYALNYAWNGVQYMVTRGIPDWESTQNYGQGDVVRSQGKFYSATSAANNINRQPAANPTFWSLWYVFQADLGTLFITAAQVATTYLPRTEAASIYATTATLNSTRINLQNQIDQIQIITGRGYLAGAGIAISSENVISNTSPNVNADWNAGVGTPGNILNKPSLAVVATSGSYNDLSNRPTFATVATSGRWQDLTGIPDLQVNSDWNATSGVAQILNKPQIPNIQTDTYDRVIAGQGIRCRRGFGGALQENAFNFSWEGGQAVFFWMDTINYGTLYLISDYRFKESVSVLSSALPLVMQLRPITYKWKTPSDNIVHAGFLAHEVQEVFPGAAEGIKDELTVDGKMQPQRLNDRDLIALLTKAVQELSVKVDQLERHELGNT